MSHQDEFNNFGFGPTTHIFEQDGKGGQFTWELTMLFSLLVGLPIAILQFLTLLLTPIGFALASTGMFAHKNYGIYNHPMPILITGIAVWIGLRMVRIGLTNLLGGGAMSRDKLYGTK